MSSLAPKHGMFMIARGIFVPIEGGDLAQFVGYPAADFGVLDYLVLNQLAIVARGDAVCLDLCLNARDFDSKNLQAVIDHLDGNPAYLQVRMRWFLGGWLTETFFDTATAVARLRMIGERRLTAPEAPLRLATQDPASLCLNTGGLYDLWQRHRGKFSSAFVADAVRQGVLDRTFALEHDDTAGWVVRLMGDAIGIFAAQRADPVGHALAASAVDHAYTRWVASHYGSVLDTGQGRYDHVDAIVSTSAKVPTRVRYRRRLLPFVSLHGKPLVVGYSALSSDLALPL